MILLTSDKLPAVSTARARRKCDGGRDFIAALTIIRRGRATRRRTPIAAVRPTQAGIRAVLAQALRDSGEEESTGSEQGWYPPDD
jgi:hypothetical protein